MRASVTSVASGGSGLVALPPLRGLRPAPPRAAGGLALKLNYSTDDGYSAVAGGVPGHCLAVAAHERLVEDGAPVFLERPPRPQRSGERKKSAAHAGADPLRRRDMGDAGPTDEVRLVAEGHVHRLPGLELAPLVILEGAPMMVPAERLL